MARIARVIAVGIPHHVTQRGNARRFILPSDADKRVYFDLLRQYATKYLMRLIGYCLMSNHVHLVVIPERADSLSLTFKNAHGRYATHWNVENRSCGHAWQGRFFSCPLDEQHLWITLRYVELNPVRAGLVKQPEQYCWSSAAAHTGAGSGEEWMDMGLWQSRWDVPSWRQFLAAGTSEAEAAAIRESTHAGRPLGAREFVDGLEQDLRRRLAPQAGGRPPKPAVDQRQVPFAFDGD